MIYSEFKKVRCVVLDVDGVLTDGRLLVTEKGEFLRSFNVKDGYAMKYAVENGLELWVITGGSSEGVRLRMKGLGLSEVHLSVKDKLELLKELSKKHDIPAEEMLFIGDDIPDLEAMKWTGLSACPKDAVEEIKKISDYISPFEGGNAMVRDLLEKIMKIQRKWTEDTHIKST